MSTTTTRTKLSAKVDAVVRANHRANQLWNLLMPTFSAFVGKQITKNDGSLLARVEKLLPTLPRTADCRVWHRSSQYSLCWEVQASAPIGDPTGFHTVVYHEAACPIGKIENGILTELYPPMNYRTDYSPEEILEKRADHERAQQALYAAECALRPFGVFDK